MHRLPPPPVLPRSPARIPFPLIAVIAPLVGAIVIGLVTGSPFVLVFALLSPLIAVATTLDARRTARRHVRAESERFDRECRAYQSAIVRAHDDERSEANTRHPRAVVVDAAAREPIRIGSAPAPSASAPEDVLITGDSPDEHRLRDLLTNARINPDLPVTVPRGRIIVHGSGLVADALERRLAREPHVELISSTSHTHSLADVTLRVVSATRLEVHAPGRPVVIARPEFVSRVQLAGARAREESLRPVGPPMSVRWRDVGWAPLRTSNDDAASRRLRGVAYGHTGQSVAYLDLENDGPHALVGGTTGSGKSEFLRALALGWAAQRGPNEVQLLFVDFKGGATFSGLTDLPHAVGLVTDLDPLVAQRAVQSLHAELRRRERVLVEAGVRDLSQRHDLFPRLIVMVDEFAALSESFPEVHAVFADISARGRSLGVHLVVCTQHPSAVIRDVVAANCAVRIAFRMSDSAGASFIGAQGRDLVSSPPGRAVVVTADGVHAVQVAAIDDADIAAVCDRWATARPGDSPWLPPLPANLDRAELHERVDLSTTHSIRSDGVLHGDTSELEPLVFGILDDPTEQRQLPAAWWPRRDGALAVVGAPRSGRSTALAALATAAWRSGARPVITPSSVVEAWALFEQLAEQPGERTVLIADDLDLLLAASTDLAPDLLSRWDAAARAVRRLGGGVAASMGALSTSRSMLSNRFESRLVLRCLDADDHHLAGAPRGLFDRAAPAGRGWWTDRQVQVVNDSLGALAPEARIAPLWEAPASGDTIVITRDVAEVAARLAKAYPAHSVIVDLASEQSAVAIGPRIFVADPEAWQAMWSLFSSLRRTSPVACLGVESADLRSLLTIRETLPPIDSRAGELWVSESGRPPQRRRVTANAVG
ncbi:FtsK/SpoIIIE domain-containing protein [Microcella sp.]|uniref:FtsK/SpoIIIE domain-containing protein n=1 Tax=Microcella sp. TaxID=1913979 RepID=UPI00299F61EE|nr:FtsK/SpoIIIE domain-containing protein [Microcella sp.]MDX2025300.1 FtsK/SpoIIIE domain-containing protein [Microcella sp.]